MDQIVKMTELNDKRFMVNGKVVKMSEAEKTLWKRIELLEEKVRLLIKEKYNG